MRRSRASAHSCADAHKLRRVKKTVDFDAPDVYHLYYGDETGTPGSVMTRFPLRYAACGRRGTGDEHATRDFTPLVRLTWRSLG